MGLPGAVFAGFLFAALAPLLHRVAGRATAWLLALVPVAISAYLISLLPSIVQGRPAFESYSWIPALGLRLAFRCDGLSALFGLIVSGVGAFVLIYSGRYLSREPHLGRFLGLLLLFMASMLGIVLADNVLLLYVFWELTSVSSWLLIGFDSRKRAARQAAWQALLVTSSGGLALLAGFVLLGQAAGTFELGTLTERVATVRGSPLHVPILLLLLLGAFTKSAQVPFHFWVPNAMEAPTPVSAYLHSATMVKAGVYLVARISPVLGGTELWWWLVVGGGTLTMLTGAWLAVVHTDMKRILAYTTVSALGMMMLMIGLGGEHGLTAAMVFVLAHALYKGPLFLVAGIVDHATGTRDASRLRGLGRAMPLVAAATLVAFISMVGAPPSLGFIGHEGLLKVAREPGAGLGVLLTVAAVLASVLYTTAGCIISFRPFFGRRTDAPDQPPYHVPFAMWVSAAVLAAAGVLGALFATDLGRWVIAPAAAAALGEPIASDLKFWHGMTLEFVLSMAAIAAGIVLYIVIPIPPRRTRWLADLAARVGPDRLYAQMVRCVNRVSQASLRLAERGKLADFVLVVLLSTLAWVCYAGALSLPSREITADRPPLWQLLLGVLVLAGLGGVILLESRIGAIASLGIVGYAVSLFFAFFAAPDLAITQILVETVFVVLLVLLLRRLPRFDRISPRRVVIRDAVVAVAFGAMISWLLIVVSATPPPSTLADFYAANSKTSAHGRNLVNVILVDFRALDTLCEITVLSVAAFGVHGLLRRSWKE